MNIEYKLKLGTDFGFAFPRKANFKESQTHFTYAVLKYSYMMLVFICILF